MSTVEEHLRLLAPAIRATVKAARRAVREAAPAATEIAYRSSPPRAKGAMWKLARYVLGDTEVAGIGTTPTYVHLWFYRGADLDDGPALLVGRGKTMRSVKLSTPRDAASPDVKRLLRRAFRLASGEG